MDISYIYIHTRYIHLTRKASAPEDPLPQCKHYYWWFEHYWCKHCCVSPLDAPDSPCSTMKAVKSLTYSEEACGDAARALSTARLSVPREDAPRT